MYTKKNPKITTPFRGHISAKTSLKEIIVKQEAIYGPLVDIYEIKNLKSIDQTAIYLKNEMGRK